MAYLNDGKAEHRRSDIAYPHTGEHCYKHACEQDVSRFRACLAEHERSHHLCNVVFRQCCSNGEATKKKHDDWCPHSTEHIRSRCLALETVVWFCISSDYLKHDHKEWYKQ